MYTYTCYMYYVYTAASQNVQTRSIPWTHRPIHTPDPYQNAGDPDRSIRLDHHGPIHARILTQPHMYAVYTYIHFFDDWVQKVWIFTHFPTLRGMASDDELWDALEEEDGKATRKCAFYRTILENMGKWDNFKGFVWLGVTKVLFACSIPTRSHSIENDDIDMTGVFRYSKQRPQTTSHW